MRELRVLDQAERRGKLGIGERGRDSLERWRLGWLDRQPEDFFGEVIDSMNQAAPACQDGTRPEITQVWFGFQLALEEFKGFAQTKMDDTIEGFTLDLPPGETGFRGKVERFTRQTVPEDGAAFVDLESLGAARRGCAGRD